MKTLLLLFLLLLLPSLAFGSPFLVCDPNPGAEKIILEINGVEIPEFAAEADGSLRYDLEGLADGDFIIKAKAGDEWGWSDWSLPFSDTKALPVAPGGLRVSSE